METNFDYIIVGAGTAGCLLANRLSADASKRVLLIEAGRADDYHWIHIPVGYLYCIGNPRTDWLYNTEPDAGLNGRTLRYPRGKTLGGCSSINGMIYMRGQARDYNQWAELLGDPAWRWENSLPYFMRHEDHHRGGTPLHGSGGEWRVEKQRLRWDVLDAFAQAAAQAGIAPTDDFNRGDNEGVGYFEVNQKSGWRWNTAKAFLRPTCMARPNFTLWTRSQVAKLLVEPPPMRGLRCTGVQVWNGHEMVTRHGPLPKCCCAPGPLAHPQLLQLSGLGPCRLAAGPRYPGAARHARRGRQLARPPANPRRLQGAKRHHAQHPGQQPVGQGQDWSGIRAHPQRPHEHGAQPARRLHPQRPRPSPPQPGVPRATAEPGRLWPAAAQLQRLHCQCLQPEPHQPRHGADQVCRSSPTPRRLPPTT